VQARDVLSNGSLALELSSSLAGYDLSQIHGGGALRAPAAPAAHAAQRVGGGGRLPPLGGWGEGGSEGLRAHAEELQEANTCLERTAEELRLECRRLGQELDAARAGARGGPGGEAPQPQPHQQDAGRRPPYRARALDWGLGRGAGASQGSPRVRAGRADARGTRQAAAPPAAGVWGGERAYSPAPAVGGEGADGRQASGGARPIVFHETEAAMWEDFATPPRQTNVLHHSRSADALLQEVRTPPRPHAPPLPRPSAPRPAARSRPAPLRVRAAVHGPGPMTAPRRSRTGGCRDQAAALRQRAGKHPEAGFLAALGSY